MKKCFIFLTLSWWFWPSERDNMIYLCFGATNSIMYAAK